MEYTDNGIKVHVTVYKAELKLAIMKEIAKEGEVHSSQLRHIVMHSLLAELKEELGRVEILFTLTDMLKDGDVVDAGFKIIYPASPEKAGKAAKMYKLKGPE